MSICKQARKNLLMKKITKKDINRTSKSSDYSYSAAMSNSYGSKSNKSNDLFSNPEKFPDAVTTLLGFAQSETDFYPGNSISISPNALDEYIETVLDMPYFEYIQTYSENKDYNKDDYFQFAYDLADFVYDTLASNGIYIDENQLTNNLIDMGKAVLYSSGDASSEGYFIENILHFYGSHSDPQCKYFIADTRLHLVNKDGKNEVDHQCYQVSITEISVRRDLMIEDENELNKLIESDVNEWINSMTSPSGNRQVCFADKLKNRKKS